MLFFQLIGGMAKTMASSRGLAPFPFERLPRRLGTSDESSQTNFKINKVKHFRGGKTHILPTRKIFLQKKKICFSLNWKDQADPVF